MRTVGVEEELLLVDPKTGEPQALSSAVLARVARDDTEEEGAFEKELHTQIVEFATPPRSGMAELRTEIVRGRKEAARHAEEIGCAVVALATSPLAVSPSIGAERRYQWMAERYGVTTNGLVLGCHVHVSVGSDEEGVAVLDRIRPWLPVLTALSANSPFWQGRDTRYASFRSRVWQRWPSAGPTEVFGSAERYHRRVADMVATGVILDEGMVYFDARLARRYPTVEIRVADVCLHSTSAVLIATLTRALVETGAREWRAGRQPHRHTVSLLRLAAWQAARSGLTGELLHPATMRRLPAQAVVQALLDHVAEPLTESGDLDLARETCAELLRTGTGADVQRELSERTGGLREVVTECVRRTQE